MCTDVVLVGWLCVYRRLVVRVALCVQTSCWWGGSVCTDVLLLGWLCVYRRRVGRVALCVQTSCC